MTMSEWEAQNPIVRWRASKKKSQQDVAVATDSSNSLVRDWEKGRVFPSWVKVEALAALMERNAAKLEHTLRLWWLGRPEPQEVTA